MVKNPSDNYSYVCIYHSINLSPLSLTLSSPKFPTTVSPVILPVLPFISPISISCLPLPDFTIYSFKLAKNSSFTVAPLS